MKPRGRSRALLPETRVIALSMYDEADKKEKMYRAGAESYVLKTLRPRSCSPPFGGGSGWPCVTEEKRKPAHTAWQYIEGGS